MLRKKWGYIFNSDIEVVTLVASLLPITALTQLFDAIIAVSAGILRARGKQVLGAFLNLTAFYVIGIPFGILFAFKLHLQLLGLWLGLCTALVYAAAASLWFVLRTDWEKEVERTRERLGGFGDDDEGATRSPVIRARRRTMSNGGGRV